MIFFFGVGQKWNSLGHQLNPRNSRHYNEFGWFSTNLQHSSKICNCTFGSFRHTSLTSWGFCGQCPIHTARLFLGQRERYLALARSPGVVDGFLVKTKVAIKHWLIQIYNFHIVIKDGWNWMIFNCDVRLKNERTHPSLRRVVYCMCVLWRLCPSLNGFSEGTHIRKTMVPCFQYFPALLHRFFFSSVLYRGILFAVSWTPSSCALHSKKAKSRACIWDTNHHRPACATDVFDEP